MRLMHPLAVVLIAVMLVASPSWASANQPEGEPFDLAMVPLPVDALPESGYQVLTGGFVDRELTAHWIASPRNGDTVEIEEMMSSSGWVSTYVLDLVLLQDRTDGDSSILSLVQTNVYLFADADGAGEGMASLGDFSTTSTAEPIDPVIQDATSVYLTSESGNTYRSVVQRDRVAIEVVTLESPGHANLSTHRRIVADSVDRLVSLQSTGKDSIAPHAVLIEDGDAVADLFNAPQTGVHQLYRVREGAVQPAAGEYDGPPIEAIAPGMAVLYQTGQAIHVDNGTGYYSSWIGKFDSIEDAALFVASLDAAIDSSLPGAVLPDPYFDAWANETVVRQGVAGVYRVSGTSVNGAFSGTLEVRQHGQYVIGIGWRVWGSVMPEVDVTSRLMDAQMACLDSPAPCVPVTLSDLMPPDTLPGATPISPTGAVASFRENQAHHAPELEARDIMGTAR